MARQSHLNGDNVRFQRNLLGSLDAATASKVVAAGGDVAMIIDRDGVICDLAIGNDDLQSDGFESLLDKRWADTVTVESRIKVEELLRDASGSRAIRWREVNHPTPHGDSIAMRYIAVDAGADGRVIAIGRDHRAAAVMQQRLVEAQQSMERDYARLRDAEARYRLLFQQASEAVLIVDGGTRRVVEANPAADRLVGSDGALVGRAFARVFAVQSQEAAAALLSIAQAATRPTGAQQRLTANGRDFVVSASLFRQDRATHFLVRLSPAERRDPSTPDSAHRLLAVLERIPDGFVVTDESLQILAENTAFLDLVRVPSKEQVRGLSLDRFLGRPGIDRNILMDMLRKHGAVRNFSTVIRTQFFEQEDVEVSAVTVSDGSQPCVGFSIRSVSRRHAEPPRERRTDLPQSAADMSALVGRASLKEIVRDTTDLVERLCIEAALELTGNNRASAAEVLGLSRQSLYSKLHRYGIGNLDPDPG